MERSRPRISANKLAEYIYATPSRRKNILKDQKYPPTYQVIRYNEAEKPIARFLSGGTTDYSVLTNAIANLEASPTHTDYQEQKKALNIEAIRGFMGLLNQLNFNGFKLSLGRHDPTDLHVEGVDISVRPEVIASATKAGRQIIGGIKLSFSKTYPHTRASGQLVGTLIHWYAETHLNDFGTAHHSLCQVIDVPSSLIHMCPRAIKNRRRDIAAACEEIASRWDSL